MSAYPFLPFAFAFGVIILVSILNRRRGDRPPPNPVHVKIALAAVLAIGIIGAATSVVLYNAAEPVPVAQIDATAP